MKLEFADFCLISKWFFFFFDKWQNFQKEILNKKRKRDAKKRKP